MHTHIHLKNACSTPTKIKERINLPLLPRTRWICLRFILRLITMKCNYVGSWILKSHHHFDIPILLHQIQSSDTLPVSMHFHRYQYVNYFFTRISARQIYKLSFVENTAIPVQKKILCQYDIPKNQLYHNFQQIFFLFFFIPTSSLFVYIII